MTRETRKDAIDQQHVIIDRPDAKTVIRNEHSAQMPDARIPFPILFQTPNTATRNSTLKGSSTI
jgi:hypothetical protein